MFGKLINDESIHFTEILRQFLQNEYDEDLTIFAIVKESNKDKKTVYKILEEIGFVTTDCFSERMFIPNNC